MKKKLLLPVFVFISTMASAQFTVWEDDFNDGDISDWTVLDLNEDDFSWQANKNMQLNEEGVFDLTIGDYNVLAVYGIDLETGGPLGDSEFVFDEWAVSPAIDLSFYAGAGELVINAQAAIYGSGEILTVYASTSMDPETFEMVGTVDLLRPEIDDVALFSDYTLDISDYISEPEVYIIFNCSGNNNALNIGIEIDNVHIIAEEIATGIEGIAGKTTTKIKQNPVQDNLQLQLANTINNEALSLNIYNINGMLVKQAAYNENGIAVTDLSSGMYFVVLTDGAATERLKFIKK
ncbi:T9SS type A sorting domain-containing protein [Flavobacterium rhizosphaerae]|uniref:T9SS type A sorting domain-containing protein n=1 Tax=Flavobacterium rhizosphaerae TaxID=3163298 RepID=A0ABW8YX72_9FLAO